MEDFHLPLELKSISETLSIAYVLNRPSGIEETTFQDDILKLKATPYFLENKDSPKKFTESIHKFLVERVSISSYGLTPSSVPSIDMLNTRNQWATDR